jgi:hypothetical protein
VGAAARLNKNRRPSTGGGASGEHASRERKTATHDLSHSGGGGATQDRRTLAPVYRMENGPGPRARVESNKPKDSARNQHKATGFATKINTKNRILRSNTKRLRAIQALIFQQKSNKILTQIRGGLRPPTLFLIGTKI